MFWVVQVVWKLLKKIMKTINIITFIACCFVFNLNAISQNSGSIIIKGNNIYLDVDTNYFRIDPSSNIYH